MGGIVHILEILKTLHQDQYLFRFVTSILSMEFRCSDVTEARITHT